MRPHSYSSEGIILARRNYSEADRILTIYSRDDGKITLIAKGIRKPKSKKRGGLEIFSYIKYSAVNTHSLDVVTEVEVIDNFDKVRQNLNKVSLAYYFIEVVGKITHEGEPNIDLLNLLLETLEELDHTKKLKQLRTAFVYKLLVLLGYWQEESKMNFPDAVLEDVIEREVNSVRVGKRILE